MTDITLCVTPKVRESMGQNQWKAFTGHLGTHFDVMDKVFPMEYAEREGIIFDVSRVGDGEVQISDIDLTLVKADMAVIFATGFIEKVGYGNPTYFKEHPTLSPELIDALLLRHISIIGVDCAGVRRARNIPRWISTARITMSSSWRISVTWATCFRAVPSPAVMSTRTR